MIFLFICLLFTSAIEAGDVCKYKNQKDYAADELLGLKCDPLDSLEQLRTQGYNSRCECLQKGEKFTRTKEWLFNKSRQRKADRVQEALVKKTADAIRAQIDQGFEQSLRLDALLKQSVINTSGQYGFPSDCRMNKVQETLDDILKSTKKDGSCRGKDNLIKERMEALFGEGGINQYLKKRTDLFSQVAQNALTDEQKKAGACLPYKAYQSFSSVNQYRKTYLTLAQRFFDNVSRGVKRESFKTEELYQKYVQKESFAKFQKWVTNRNYSSDIKSLLAPRPEEENGLLSRKDNKDIEYDMDAIVMEKLLKTDPIFERMAKDPNFFNDIRSDVQFSGLRNFNENSPKTISAMIESQKRQCQKLYGENEVEISTTIDNKSQISNNKKSSEDDDAPTPAAQPGKTTKKVPNILTRFLCEEGFPKQFLNLESIKDVIAPEVQKSADINTIKQTVAIVTRYAYCSKDKSYTLPDGTEGVEFSENMSDKEENKIEDFSKFLNLNLNPSSDLQDPKVSDYKKFNDLVCPFISAECKDPKTIPSEINSCYTAKIAEDAIEGMLGSENSDKDKMNLLFMKVKNSSMSDEEMRAMLRAEHIGDDKINAIIALKSQVTRKKYDRLKEEIRLALGKATIEEVNTEINEKGYKAVLENPNIPQSVRDRYINLRTSLRADNLLRESNDGKSSYFSNYYVLTDKEDEQKVKTAITNFRDGKSVSTGPIGSSLGTVGSASNVGSGGTGTTQAPTDLMDQVYERKSFEPVASTLPTVKKQELPVVSTPTPPLAGTTPAKSLAATKETTTKETPSRSVASSSSTTTSSTSPLAGPVQNYNRNFTLSGGGSGAGESDIGHGGDFSKLDKMNRDLDKMNRDLSQLDKSKKEADAKRKEELEKEKQKLQDEIARTRRVISDSRRSVDNGGSISSGNNFANNNDIGIDDFGSNRIASNGGSNRGTEFDREKFIGKPDDGSAMFDDKEKNSAGSVGGESGSGSGEKGKGKNIALNGSGGDGEGGAGGGMNGANGKRRGPASLEGKAIAEKCGTGRVLKCYFPQSVFTDPVMKDMLYTAIKTYKLEGRTFYTAEKIKHRRSRGADKAKVERYLIKYTLTNNSSNKEQDALTVEDQDKIFKEIKERREESTFKQKLIKYKKMTNAIYPKRSISETESLDILKNTLSSEELKEYLNDIN